MSSERHSSEATTQGRTEHDGRCASGSYTRGVSRDQAAARSRASAGADVGIDPHDAYYARKAARIAADWEPALAMIRWLLGVK